MTAKPGRDPWAAWPGERGHGGDAELLRRQLEVLAVDTGSFFRRRRQHCHPTRKSGIV